MIQFLLPTLLRGLQPSSHCSRLWPSPVIVLGGRLDLHPSKPQRERRCSHSWPGPSRGEFRADEFGALRS
jgi:hypothetical protein